MSRRKPADVAAHDNLSALLRQLDDEGRAVPCVGSERPVSDDEEEREYVALAWCPRCPVVDACRAAGKFHKFGIWGGVDTTARTYKTSTSKDMNR